MTRSKQRLQNEIKHGKLLCDISCGELWYWSTAAGRIRFERRCQILCEGIAPGQNILEIGCGPGGFTAALAKTGANITAVDISPDLLHLAQQRVTAANVRFQAGNASSLPFPDKSFDLVLGSSILHHLDTTEAFKDFLRVLKPGGQIRFTEPNLLNPHVFLERHIAFIRKMCYVSPDETAFLRWRLKKSLLNAGFFPCHIRPFDFLHPLTPRIFIPVLRATGSLLEKLPLISEISGSLFIRADKPISRAS